MTESEWQQCDNFWVLMRGLRDAPEPIHRKIGRAVLHLASDSFSPLEMRGVSLIDQLILGTADKTECERIQTELQKTLPPDDCSSVPASVIIWAIQPPTSSYPPFYATAIAASNVVEMSRATPVEICDIIRSIADYSLAQNAG